MKEFDAYPGLIIIRSSVWTVIIAIDCKRSLWFDRVFWVFFGYGFNLRLLELNANQDLKKSLCVKNWNCVVTNLKQVIRGMETIFPKTVKQESCECKHQ